MSPAKIRWGAAIGFWIGWQIVGAQAAAALTCGTLRLMDASGVIGPLQRYTATADCGEEHTASSGTKLTWTGWESSSKNMDVSFKVTGKASWDRKTGEATETLLVSGDASGQRVAKGICNEDPFLKDPPGGSAECYGIQSQYDSKTGPVYQFFTSSRFFLARTVSLVEAQALSGKKPSSNPPPPPPDPSPGPSPAVPKTMTSPSGARVWEGEDLLKLGRVVVNGGKPGPQPMRSFGAGWGGDNQLLWVDGQVGAVIDLQVDVPSEGAYRVSLSLTKGPDYGLFQAEVGGMASPLKFDGFSQRVTRVDSQDFGVFPLGAGKRTIALMIIGKNSQSRGFLVGIDRITLTPVKKQARS